MHRPGTPSNSNAIATALSLLSLVSSGSRADSGAESNSSCYALPFCLLLLWVCESIELSGHERFRSWLAPLRCDHQWASCGLRSVNPAMQPPPRPRALRQELHSLEL